MVTQHLFRQCRTHQRGNRQTIHPNTEGKNLTAIPPRPQEAENPRPNLLNCTRLDSNVIEIEFDDGLLHYRLNLSPNAAHTLLTLIDSVLKEPSANKLERIEDLRFDVWDDGGNRYGIRISNHGASITGRVSAIELDTFADKLEQFEFGVQTGVGLSKPEE